MQFAKQAGRATRGVGAGVALVIATAVAAGAQQQRELFRWSGRVDQEIQLTMSGRNLTATNTGPSEPGQRRASVISPIPRAGGEVTVQVVNGRGTVDVLQQPTAANGYTTIVRIRDPQGGAADYRVNAYWQPVAAGEVGPPFGRGYGRGRNNRLALQWSGDVDGNLLITVRPGGVSYRTERGAEPKGIQSSFNGIPTGAVSLGVVQREGRGQVVVVQQPTPENGYTALLRVRDPQPGYGHYSFDVNWQ